MYKILVYFIALNYYNRCRIQYSVYTCIRELLYTCGTHKQHCDLYIYICLKGHNSDLHDTYSLQTNHIRRCRHIPLHDNAHTNTHWPRYYDHLVEGAKSCNIVNNLHNSSANGSSHRYSKAPRLLPEIAIGRAHWC